jgi:hypothetical protein
LLLQLTPPSLSSGFGILAATPPSLIQAVSSFR